MEEGKLDWHITSRLERLRKAHAPKLVSGPPSSYNKKGQNDNKDTPCRFLHNGKCTHQNDHTTGGQLYKHICSHCYGLGKRLPHPQKDCRAHKRSQDSKNE